MNLNHRFLTALLLCLLPFALCRAEEETAYSRMVTIEGHGDYVYYAQNDPRWDRSLYEPFHSGNYRLMHSSGCGPTAAAIAIANVLTPQELPALLSQARDPEVGFPFCPCSVNTYNHSGDHAISDPRTPEDFLKNLPVIVASFATGNNAQRLELRKRDGFGTSTLLFEAVAQAYGLEYRGTSSWESAQAVLESGGSIVTCVTKGIFTSTSHFMVIAAADEEWVYLLDPLMRESYPLDTKHLLEIVEPGLVRGETKNLQKMGLSSFYTIKRAEE